MRFLTQTVAFLSWRYLVRASLFGDYGSFAGLGNADDRCFSIAYVGGSLMTQEEELELANLEALYEAFRRATPSSPDWYQIADHCIGVLMAKKIAEIKDR